jgi:queuine/archaeosine tRNA-ribosyltransferase
MLFARLATIHNLRFMTQLMDLLRRFETTPANQENSQV